MYINFIIMDELLDPYGDRVMKNVPMIARFPLTKDEMYRPSKHGKKVPNIDKIRKHLLREGKLNKPDLRGS